MAPVAEVPGCAGEGGDQVRALLALLLPGARRLGPAGRASGRQGQGVDDAADVRDGAPEENACQKETNIIA